MNPSRIEKAIDEIYDYVSKQGNGREGRIV